MNYFPLFKEMKRILFKGGQHNAHKIVPSIAILENFVIFVISISFLLCFMLFRLCHISFFSRESDSTTTNVRSFVRLSVCLSVCPSETKTPKQLKIIHFTLPQHTTTLNTTSQHNITIQHHNTTSQHNTRRTNERTLVVVESLSRLKMLIDTFSIL